MSAQELHFYQCSFCKSTATNTIRCADVKIDCPLCHRWMRYLVSQPVVTDADRALHARGLVLNPHLADDPNRIGVCSHCRARVNRSTLIDLSAAGKFCSAACADEGTAKHERYMRRLQDEADAQALRERPWLRQKESA